MVENTEYHFAYFSLVLMSRYPKFMQVLQRLLFDSGLMLLNTYYRNRRFKENTCLQKHQHHFCFVESSVYGNKFFNWKLEIFLLLFYSRCKKSFLKYLNYLKHWSNLRSYCWYKYNCLVWPGLFFWKSIDEVELLYHFQKNWTLWLWNIWLNKGKAEGSLAGREEGGVETFFDRGCSLSAGYAWFFNKFGFLF